MQINFNYCPHIAALFNTFDHMFQLIRSLKQVIAFWISLLSVSYLYLNLI